MFYLLFTCAPTSETVETVRTLLDNDFNNKTNFTLDQIWFLLDLHLSTTYLKYNYSFHRQKIGLAMGSPVSSVVANLYMEEERSEQLQWNNIEPLVWRYNEGTRTR